MAMSARLLVKKGERRRWFRGSLRFLRHPTLIGRRVQTEEGTEVTNIMVKILHRCSPCSRTPRTKRHCYVQWSYDRQCNQIWDHQWEKKKPHGIVSKISVHHYHVTNHKITNNRYCNDECTAWQEKNEKSSKKKKYEVWSPELSSDVFLIIGPKPIVSVLQTLFDYIITSGLSQHSDLFKEM